MKNNALNNKNLSHSPQKEERKQEKDAKIHNIRLESHFTVTYNKTADDNRLTFAARGLLWYLLSKGPDWTIYRSQLARVYEGDKQKGNGRTSIDSMMEELMKYGYIVYTKGKDEFGWWTHRYDVYPMPYDEFKKMFPELDYPIVDVPVMVNPGVLLSTNDTKKQQDIEHFSSEVSTPIQKSEPPKQKEQATASPPPVSPEARRLTLLFIEGLKREHPNIKIGSITSWEKHVDKMLRVDNRVEKEIEEAISWLFYSTNDQAIFWRSNILSTCSFRKQYDRIRALKAKNFSNYKVKEKNSAIFSPRPTNPDGTFNPYG